MNRALWIAATGMQSQQLLTETIANNMANVNTHGYKRSTVHFQDLLYQTKSSPGAATATAETPVGVQLGTGVRTVSITKNFSQGSLKNSSSALDVAIEGSGFFTVQLPDGTTAYTRTGNFTLSPTGQVVTPDGYVVTSFPTIDPTATAIDIAEDGTVTVTVNGTQSQA
ncbi:MAG: flagellar hook-basal body complex protein, partial [Lentisphaerae bacterium]